MVNLAKLNSRHHSARVPLSREGGSASLLDGIEAPTRSRIASRAARGRGIGLEPFRGYCAGDVAGKRGDRAGQARGIQQRGHGFWGRFLAPDMSSPPLTPSHVAQSLVWALRLRLEVRR
jgi:hypothetical protein